MAAKPEAAASENDSSASASGKAGMGALVPSLLAVVLAPALSWAIAQFVLIPQLKHAVEPTEAAGVHAAAGPAAHGEAKGKGKVEGIGPANSYTFENVVVNLAGTMGTRYLKATFVVTGTDVGLRTAFEASRPQLLDVTLNVLSSLTLTDLEEAGAKNIIREKLIQAFNQSFGRKVAEQIYFSDFVVQ